MLIEAKVNGFYFILFLTSDARSYRRGDIYSKESGTKREEKNTTNENAKPRGYIAPAIAIFTLKRVDAVFIVVTVVYVALLGFVWSCFIQSL